jgi:LysR family hydrogen peroxide-inducible transcriptional activator
MFWRKSSAMHGFLMQLAEVFKKLPRALLDPATLPAVSTPAVVNTPRRHYGAGKSHSKH